MTNKKEMRDIDDYVPVKHGDLVTCAINGHFIRDAKISINPKGMVFVCQDIRNGCYTDNRLGYTYSWCIYDPSKHKTFKEQLAINQTTKLVVVKEIVKEIEEIPFELPEEEELINGFDPVTTAWMNDGSSRI